MKKRIKVMQIFILIIALFSLIMDVKASYSVNLLMTTDSDFENEASEPLCVKGTVYYYRIIISKGSGDSGNGLLTMFFKHDGNNYNGLISFGLQSGSNFVGNKDTITGTFNFVNTSGNLDNGEIVMEYLDGGTSYFSDTYATSAPYSIISPASASLNTVSGPTSVGLSVSSSSSATFSWSPSNGLSVTTGSSVTAAPGTAKTYTVIATSTTSGCTALSNNSAVVTVTGPCCSSTRVFNNQTIVSDDVSSYITASGTSSIVATSTVSLKAGNYIQLDPDVSIVPSTGVFLALATACTYNACKIGMFNDENDVDPVKIDPSFGQIISDNIKIYPNPTSGIFMISSEERVESVMITNSQGTIIPSNSGLQIDLSNQPEGIYFVEISSKGKKVVKKVVKNK